MQRVERRRLRIAQRQRAQQRLQPERHFRALDVLGWGLTATRPVLLGNRINRIAREALHPHGVGGGRAVQAPFVRHGREAGSRVASSLQREAPAMRHRRQPIGSMTLPIMTSQATPSRGRRLD